jgi:hypothetical protein
VSEKSSLEFWHEFAEIHSLKGRARARKVATNAAGDGPVSHRDDRVRDQRADAAQAGLLIHDRDLLFSKAFIAILKAGGVKSVKIPAQSPNCNPHAERFVKTMKFECLNPSSTPNGSNAFKPPLDSRN